MVALAEKQKVVQLNTVRTDLIADLEDVLARAKRGEVKAVSISMLGADGRSRSRNSGYIHNWGDVHALVGGLITAQHGILCYADNLDTE